MTPSSRKFYEFEEWPAYQEGLSLPVKFTLSGQQVVYDLEKFDRLATTISEREFEVLMKQVAGRARRAR